MPNPPKRALIATTGALLCVIAVGVGAWWSIRPAVHSVETTRARPSPTHLIDHCRDAIGPPRVEEVAPGLFVAIGYDLANTILIKTPEGNVVVDVGMSPARSRIARAALLDKAPGPIRAIVYTHSHIDHVGGASAWVEDGTKIWATARFTDHFFKQYGVFRHAETLRGRRQFGVQVPDAALPCTALGARPDVVEASNTGVLMPTDTFSGETSFEVGGVTVELHEAHGETHDQLFVWLPHLEALMPGDNYYRAFPNLYTIRGTSPRPVVDWIKSLDQMRRMSPALLLPSHTVPIEGKKEIAGRLRDYRDGIQWVRDAVVRGANRGESIDSLAHGIGLPKHLAGHDALAELYGQIDWSVRAIYTNELGWFDGRAQTLYPISRPEAARRTVTMIGGPEKVQKAAREAARGGDHRWALHLIAMLRASGTSGAVMDKAEAASLRGLAETLSNTNGRAYLLETAAEIDQGGPAPLNTPAPNAGLVESVPLELIFSIMASRLIPERAIETHESAVFDFPKEKRRFTITVRRGIAEIIEGEPLPGTPEPIATIKTDARTWQRIALQVDTPAAAVAEGRLTLTGDQAAFLTFIQRFERGL